MRGDRMGCDETAEAEVWFAWQDAEGEAAGDD